MKELNPFFKSIIEQDKCAVVICDLEHTIIYMNPAADRNYAKYGGHQILGNCIFDCHNAHSVEAIKKVVAWFAADKSHNIVHTFYNAKQQKDVYMVALRDEDGELIGYYEKHEFRIKDEMPFMDLI